MLEHFIFTTFKASLVDCLTLHYTGVSKELSTSLSELDGEELSTNLNDYECEEQSTNLSDIECEKLALVAVS